jgi:hypothetical protein
VCIGQVNPNVLAPELLRHAKKGFGTDNKAIRAWNFGGFFEKTI